MLTVEKIMSMEKSGEITSAVAAVMISKVMESPAESDQSDNQPETNYAFEDIALSPSDVVQDTEVVDHAHKGWKASNDAEEASQTISEHVAGLLFKSKVLMLEDIKACNLALQTILTEAIPVDDKEPAVKTGKLTTPITKSTGLLKVAGLDKTAHYWTRLTAYTRELMELKHLSGVEAVNNCFQNNTLIPLDQVKSLVKKAKDANKTPETMKEAFARVARTTKNMAETHIKTRKQALAYEKQLATLIAGLQKAFTVEMDKFPAKAKKAA
jgi:hypothetical protein